MGGGSFKYLIPGIIAVILLSGVLLSNKFITKQSLGSIYNIEEAKTNFDNIQIGDEINYEVNGYSDWQVIGKDEYAGTIDVVSKTNTEDLTLEPNQPKEYYENKFQETANKYTDNNYVISARTVNSSDLDYFNYDNNFWLNSITEDTITSSQSTWEYNPINYKMFVIPYVEKYFENYNDYNVGDIIEYSNNGVDRWVVVEKNIWNGSSLVLIPETPIEIVIESVNDNIDTKVNQIIESFNNDVYSYGTYATDFRTGDNNLPNLISNFLNQQTEKIWLIKYSQPYMYTNYEDGIKFECRGSNILSYMPGVGFNNECNIFIYNNLSSKALGYRPVVTLKIKNEVQDKDKKEISSKLQVGDYVKYEAKGYKNWKVLGVDNDLGTVDIISVGIVKNLTLSGKEDWDNYEDIIQREADEYKSGSQAKKATTVTLSHLKSLKEIDKSILSRYWLLSKNSNIRYHNPYEEKYVDIIDYSISTIYLYKYDNYDLKINNITFYTGVSGEEAGVNHYKSFENRYSYTAGLRPVITLKLDSVEKLPEEETKRIEESTEKQEKVFIKEQESKNKNYKGPSKVDDSTSSTGNNNEVKSNDNDNTKKDNIIDNNTSNVEKIVYKDKPFYKYGFYILLVICLIETLMLIIPKINKK